MKDYEKYKDKQQQISRERAIEGREVGPLRPIKNPRRRKRCEFNLRLFLETYLAAHFPLAWSADHLAVIDDMQKVAIDGGQEAVAMPRGSGKSTIVRGAVIWAIGYGHRKFPVLLGSTDGIANQELQKVKGEIETNEVLDEDFPDMTQCPRALERVALRAKGQLFNGEPSRIEWGQDRLVFAHVRLGKKWAPCAGSVLYAAGLTGSFRGISAGMPDGSIIRPDFCIADDPQTHASAISPSQCDDRERILNADVLGLSGPGKKIACVVPCTIVAPNDLAARLLDRDRNPQWNGRTTKLVNAWPKNEPLWGEYETIRRTSMREGRHGKDATEFYEKHFDAMNEGAEVPWSARYNDDELSAIQHAFNLKMDRPGAFEAEYQNSPVSLIEGEEAVPLEADLIIDRLTRLPRRVVPREATRLTAGIDIGGELHWYVVVAWDEQYGGSVIDYGSWPQQSRAYFRADDPRPGLSTMYPGQSEEARVYSGLVDMLRHLYQTPYVRDETDDPLPISRCLVDSGYIPDSVYRGIRESGHRETTLASKGKPIRPDETPMQFWPRREGERRGWNWRIRPAGTTRSRLCLFDTNEWKSFLAARLLVPFSSPGRLGLFGDKGHEQRLFADHCTAESRIRTSGRDRIVDQWQLKPGRRDNHYFDAAVLAAVAASIDGLIWESGALAGATVTADEKRVPIKLSAMQSAKRQDSPRPAGGKVRLKLSDIQRERKLSRV